MPWNKSKTKPIEEALSLPAEPAHPPHPPGTPIRERGGCKVRWATYATIEEAEAAAAWAKVEAGIKADQGYDFGYCCPGEIGPGRPDGFEVTFP